MTPTHGNAPRRYAAGMPDPWRTHDLPFDANRADDIGRFERKEWLLTAGDGSFAMGTALGRNTRRYHGLLVAAARPPVDRVVALNQVFETLVLAHGVSDIDTTATQRLEFSTCGFRDPAGQTAYAPHGFRFLQRVERGLTMTWHYGWGDLHWSRTLVLHPAQPHTPPTITLRYDVAPFDRSLGHATLHLAPMLTLRGFHGLYDGTPIGAERTDGQAVTCRGTGHAVTLSVSSGTWHDAPDVWRGVHYPVEAYRSQGDTEDQAVPGRFVIPVQPGQSVTLTAALGGQPAAPLASPDERARRLVAVREQLRSLPEATAGALAVAADDFVVSRTMAGKRLSTIIAGYPWFADWGRDTFIALPGLLLCTGRLKEAEGVLRCFAGALRNGVVPNRFDDADDKVAHYNTVDGSMWFVHAALAYHDALERENESTPAWLIRAVTDVLDAHLAGTHADGHHDNRTIPIRCDADGLITAGDDRTQLTWMDAACDVPHSGPGGETVWEHRVFTPRPGKCVEVNALWCSNLAGAAVLLNGRRGQKQRTLRYQRAAELTGDSFLAVFWDKTRERLLDHVRPDGPPDERANAQLRPNACFACSLARSPLPAPQRRLVLDAARTRLLTPSGLRTLDPDDPRYVGTYGGPQWQRDAAYHQGTAWPWLLGTYAEGVLRADGFSDAAKQEARDAIAPLLASLTDADDPATSLGQLHEVHDGDPGHSELRPGSASAHAPRGCIAQAWSVAEVLRIACLIDTDQPNSTG